MVVGWDVQPGGSRTNNFFVDSFDGSEPEKPEPDFKLDWVSYIVAQRGGTGKILIKISRIDGFTGAVTVVASKPSVTGFKVKPKTQESTDSSPLIFKLKIAADAPTGLQMFTFTGTDATGRVRSTSIEIDIQ